MRLNSSSNNRNMKNVVVTAQHLSRLWYCPLWTLALTVLKRFTRVRYPAPYKETFVCLTCRCGTGSPVAHRQVRRTKVPLERTGYITLVTRFKTVRAEGPKWIISQVEKVLGCNSGIRASLCRCVREDAGPLRAGCDWGASSTSAGGANEGLFRRGWIPHPCDAF